ncbi:hypothetical protein BH09BAC6_BH09BAC6_06660 [soil metagenome]|jgi:predicted transcriptional regulator
MTVIELKAKLIEKINNTNDYELLDHISEVFEFESRVDETYEMSPGEIEAVNEGLEQIKNGQWLSHEEANSQVAEWLKK